MCCTRHMNSSLAVSLGQLTTDLKGHNIALVGKIDGGDCGIKSLSDLITNVNNLFNETENTFRLSLCIGTWLIVQGVVNTLLYGTLQVPLAVSLGQLTTDLKGHNIALVGKIDGGDSGINCLSDLITNVNNLFNDTEKSLSVLDLVVFFFLLGLLVLTIVMIVLPLVALFDAFPVIVGVVLTMLCVEPLL